MPLVTLKASMLFFVLLQDPELPGLSELVHVCKAK